MNHTARQLFPTWYLKSAYKNDSLKIEAYLKSIDSAIAISDKNFWLDIVKLYLGIKLKNSPNKTKFVALFIEHDPSFPATENENLLRILAVCSLAILLDENDNLLTYQVALSITNCLLLNQYDTAQYKFVADFALKNEQKYSISDREQELEKLDSGLSIIDDEIDDDEEVEDTEISISNKDLRILHDSIKILGRTYRALSEENNILWWLYSGISQFTNKPFSENSIQSMIFYAPQELYKLTKFESGVFNSKHFLHKALLLSNNNKSLKKQNLFELINNELDLSTANLLESFESNITIFTPLMLALKSSYTLKGEDWSSHFKGESNQANIKQSFPPELIAHQFYKELLFLNIN